MGEAKRREKLELLPKKVELNELIVSFHGFQLPNQELRNILRWV
tara:strand:- start:710 stop:841 length:132 start_codon:yes stop_codon:yes gene_type:complete